MLINLSNHPSELWSVEQMNAARQYGEIVDMPFPQISPEASHEDVAETARSFLNLIMTEAEAACKNGDEVTVHIMGEMTFTFALVTLLKAEGIPCVASTTERKVSTTDDGKKISEFTFMRFREY